jgi:hypothetical protein
VTKKTIDQHFEVDLTIPAMRMNQFHDQLLCLDQCGRNLSMLRSEGYPNVPVLKMAIRVTCPIPMMRNHPVG